VAAGEEDRRLVATPRGAHHQAPRHLLDAAVLEAAVDVVLQALAADPAAVGKGRGVEQRERPALA